VATEVASCPGSPLSCFIPKDWRDGARLCQALEMLRQRLLMREEAQQATRVPQAEQGERRLMDLKLHANATTTPRIRAYIQRSAASSSALARELGIHSRTVARWKGRPDVVDRSTRPHRLATTMTDWEEALIVELRRSLALPLDDITEAMRRCVNPRLSRSAIHRCLQRHAISARLTPDEAPAAVFQTAAPAGFIPIDVKYLPPLDRRRSYAGACPGAKPGSPSIAPPALSISKSCPIAGPKPRPAFSAASAPASRLRSIPS
jgi:hypothetical protein